MFRIASTSEKLGKMLLKTTFYSFFCLMLFRKQPIKQKCIKKTVTTIIITSIVISKTLRENQKMKSLITR